MAWKESGGGAEDPLDREAEAETLLEDTVTSPEDVPDGLRNPSNHEALEEQPLIDNDSPVKTKVLKVTTPKLSKKEISKSSSKSSPLIASRSNPKVPVMITLDPSDRVSLNTGKKTSVWNICFDFYAVKIFAYILTYLRKLRTKFDVKNSIRIPNSKSKLCQILCQNCQYGELQKLVVTCCQTVKLSLSLSKLKFDFFTPSNICLHFDILEKTETNFDVKKFGQKRNCV